MSVWGLGMHSDLDQALAENRAVDAFLVACLSGDVLPPLEHPEHLPSRALYHGVSVLIAAKYDVHHVLPAAVVAALRHQALAEAMWDLRHRQVIGPVLEALAEAGVCSVILKGTALAYSVYSAPSSRPRGDTDLLASPSQRSAVYRCFLQHGFERSPEENIGAPNDLHRQELWRRKLSDGSEHLIDLHWGVMHSWSLAHLFDTDTVLRSSQALPRLSPSARMMAYEHALYHACLHRAVHVQSPYHVGGQTYTGGDRLIWLQDIDLLARAMTEQDWRELLALCHLDKTADICFGALSTAQTLLGTPLPGQLLADLKALIRTGGPSKYLLHTRRSQQLVADLYAIRGIRDRLSFFRRILFPSRAFMRAKYPDLSAYPVFIPYVVRALNVLRQEPKTKNP